MFENFIFNSAKEKKRFYAYLSLAIFSFLAIAYLILAIYVAPHPVNSFDISLLQKIQSVSLPFFPGFMKFVSLFGEAYTAPFVIAIITLLLYLNGHKREAVITPIILFGSAFSQFSKEITERSRPLEFSLDFGYTDPGGYSFPSGHVVFYTLAFGLLAFLAFAMPNLTKQIRITLFLISAALVVLVGVSRVYLGVHWPTDVLGGYLIGFALLEILVLAYLKFAYLPQMRNKKNQTN